MLRWRYVLAYALFLPHNQRLIRANKDRRQCGDFFGSNKLIGSAHMTHFPRRLHIAVHEPAGSTTVL